MSKVQSRKPKSGSNRKAPANGHTRTRKPKPIKPAELKLPEPIPPAVPEIDRALVLGKLRQIALPDICVDIDSSCLLGDPGSHGHLFTGYMDDEHEEQFFMMDDRKGDVREQLIAEVERVAAAHMRVAQRMREKLHPGTATQSKEEFSVGPLVDITGPVELNSDNPDEGPRHYRDWSLFHYPLAVIHEMSQRYSDALEFTVGERITTVKVKSPDAEIVISSVEPPRQQLVKEFTRLSKFYEWCSDRIRDDDWGRSECVQGDYAPEWKSLCLAASSSMAD